MKSILIFLGTLIISANILFYTNNVYDEKNNILVGNHICNKIGIEGQYLTGRMGDCEKLKWYNVYVKNQYLIYLAGGTLIIVGFIIKTKRKTINLPHANPNRA
jgi:hypothetical protein